MGHKPADLTSGPQVPGRTQAGAEQCGDTLRVLTSVAVDDDGAQSTKAVTLQQCHQSLVGDSGQWGLSEAVPLVGPGACTYLLWVPVHGHREVQVGRDGDRLAEDKLLGHA